MVAFPSSPTTGQQYLQWVWDGVKWIAAPTALPQCGRLAIVGASPSTQIAFSPYKGNLIKLNGVIRQIPSAGIISSASSSYVNGVLGALPTGTLLYVYLFDTGTALALDFSTTTHATSTTAGNVGVEIKSGDDTRSLVGMTQLGASQFYDGAVNRMIRSWFNRPSSQLTTGAVSWSIGAAAWTTLGQLSMAYCAFADDVFFGTHSGQAQTAAAGATIMATGIGNATTLFSSATVTSPAAGYQCPMTSAYAFQAEGTTSVYGWVYNNTAGLMSASTGVSGILS